MFRTDGVRGLSLAAVMIFLATLSLPAQEPAQ